MKRAVNDKNDDDADSDEDFDPSDEELEIDEVRADAICAASGMPCDALWLVISTPRLLESRLWSSLVAL